VPIAAPNKRKLTKFNIRSAKPRQRAYLIWDTDTPGLALSIEPTGHKAFKCIYQFGGRTRWFTMGKTEQIHLPEARKWAHELILEVLQGRDPQGAKKTLRTAPTFGSIAIRYREEFAKHENKAWKQNAHLVDKYMMPIWSKLNIQLISRTDVRAMLEKVNGDAQFNKVLTAASAIFTWAGKIEITNGANPCHRIERKVGEDRERILNDAEVGQLWSALDNYGVAGKALKVTLLTGQRPGEVCHMRYEHLGEPDEGRWWEMPGLPTEGWPGTKNGRTHRVWLSLEVLDVLPDDGSEHGYVFPRIQDGLDATMRRVCHDLNIKNKITPHDFRRTVASSITRLNYSEEAMDRILNHYRKSVSKTYNRHNYDRQNQDILERVALHMLDLVKNYEEVQQNLSEYMIIEEKKMLRLPKQ
jgi:integrase